MSRSYKNVRPKKHRVYDVADVLELYGISRNALSTWGGNRATYKTGSAYIPDHFRDWRYVVRHACGDAP